MHGEGFHQVRMSVGGSAGHSGEWNVDVSEGVLGNDFQGRKWDVGIWNGSTPEVEEPENVTVGDVDGF